SDRVPAGGPVSEIELTNVSRWYGNLVEVNDISMRIGPGVTGLLGPNGAGKTTLLSMLAGFLKPSKGKVTVDGEPTWSNLDLYPKIVFVPAWRGSRPGSTSTSTGRSASCPSGRRSSGT